MCGKVDVIIGLFFVTVGGQDRGQNNFQLKKCVFYVQLHTLALCCASIIYKVEFLIEHWCYCVIFLK